MQWQGPLSRSESMSVSLRGYRTLGWGFPRIPSCQVPDLEKTPCCKMPASILPQLQRQSAASCQLPVPAGERCPRRTNHLLNKWHSDEQGGGRAGAAQAGVFNLEAMHYLHCHYSPQFDFML